MDDELKGVKGWLLVFVLIMAVISPGWGAIQAYSALHTGNAVFLAEEPLFVSLRNVTWGVVAFTFVIGWIVAWRLLAIHNWTSVRIAIAGIWLSSVGSVILAYALITWVLGLPADALAGEVGVPQFIRPFIFGLIWTSYLLKSERVANTYRDPGEQAEVFE